MVSVHLTSNNQLTAPLGSPVLIPSASPSQDLSGGPSVVPCLCSLVKIPQVDVIRINLVELDKCELIHC